MQLPRPDLDSQEEKNDFRSATAQRKSAEKHEGKKRATNKQHGMCFVEEKNAKQFYAMRDKRRKKNVKIRAGTVKAF